MLGYPPEKIIKGYKRFLGFGGRIAVLLMTLSYTPDGPHVAEETTGGTALHYRPAFGITAGLFHTGEPIGPTDAVTAMVEKKTQHTRRSHTFAHPPRSRTARRTLLQHGSLLRSPSAGRALASKTPPEDVQGGPLPLVEAAGRLGVRQRFRLPLRGAGLDLDERGRKNGVRSCRKSNAIISRVQRASRHRSKRLGCRPRCLRHPQHLSYVA